jgi:RND superfamily putative drug exporter
VLVAVTLTPALLGFAKGRVAGGRGLGRGIPLGRHAVRRARGDAEDSAAPVASAASKKTNPWVALVTRHPIVTRRR